MVPYIGETKTSLKRGFCGHRSTVNICELDTPVGHHFSVSNYSISGMILQGIESIWNHRELVRLSREKMWIIQSMVLTSRSLRRMRTPSLARLFMSELEGMHVSLICMFDLGLVVLYIGEVCFIWTNSQPSCQPQILLPTT